MRGEKPKPIRSPGPALTPPEPPKHLDADTKREWRRVTTALARNRLLSPAVDMAALEILCTSVVAYREATAHVRSEGAVITSGGRVVKNPWATIQAATWDRVRPLIAEFGLSPVSRARLHLDAVGEPDETADEFF